MQNTRNKIRRVTRTRGVRTSNCEKKTRRSEKVRKRRRREAKGGEDWPAGRETVKICITIVDRNNYARSARANGRGGEVGADANADARRDEKARRGEIEGTASRKHD